MSACMGTGSKRLCYECVASRDCRCASSYGGRKRERATRGQPAPEKVGTRRAGVRRGDDGILSCSGEPSAVAVARQFRLLIACTSVEPREATGIRGGGVRALPRNDSVRFARSSSCTLKAANTTDPRAQRSCTTRATERFEDKPLARGLLPPDDGFPTPSLRIAPIASSGSIRTPYDDEHTHNGTPHLAPPRLDPERSASPSFPPRARSHTAQI